MDYKVCICCKNKFVPKTQWQKYCSKRCYSKSYYKTVPYVEKDCLRCKAPYQPAQKHQRYCSGKCRRENLKKVSRGRYASLGLSSGTVGAISELLVSTDLMLKGYEVFRALSPSSSCDILARKNGQEFPIEVRTGFKNFDGSLGYSKYSIKAPYTAVFVPKDRSFHYIPNFTKASY
jgi:hypothetical protein